MATKEQKIARLSALQADWKFLWQSKPNRDFTAAETQRLQAWNDEMQELNESIQGLENLEQITRDMQGTGTGAIVPASYGGSLAPTGRSQPVNGHGLGAAVYAAGLDIRNRPSIHLESFLPAIGAAADYAPGSAAFYGQRILLPDIAPLGQDRRWLWQSLNPQPVDNAATSVDDWTQNARTLTGTVERTLAASTAKATLDLGIEFANTPLKTLAVIIENVPTQLLASQPSAMTWFNSEATFQLYKALDAHVYGAITAATPATQAWDTNILQTARMGIATMRAAGGAPTLWAMSPADHALIDTLQSADGQFIATSSPEGSGTSMLWSLPVIESPAVTGDLLLIEPARLGVLVVGSLDVLIDPFSKMSTNLVDIRFELNALMHIRQIDAALSVADSAT